MSIHFIGDLGLDLYHIADDTNLLVNKKYYLGGCSFNSAYHYQKVSKEGPNLFYLAPNNLTSFLSKEVTQKIFELKNAIKFYPLKGLLHYPLQEIEILENGEKNFIKYTSGICEDFDISQIHDELNSLALIKPKDLVVMPVFSQFFKFNNLIFNHLEQREVSFILDFLDGEDFDKDFDRIMPYLKKASLSVFGLNMAKNTFDHKLSDKLSYYASMNDIEVLITQSHHQIIYYKNRKRYTYQPKKSENVIDTTGAGDSFLAAFIHYKSILTPIQALQRASEYAKLVVEQIGATPILINNER